MNYSFLEGLVLQEKPGSRIKKPKNVLPEGLTLRIFSNGNVHPSKELVEKFNLEYKHKDDEEVGNGIDIVDSLKWPLTATLPRMILFGITSKKESKVDLFATCRYNDSGLPMKSVLEQTATCEELLDLVRQMGYLTEEQSYCDLEVVIDHPIRTQDGIANLPKVYLRGARKGEETYERRENITLYPVNVPENLKKTTDEKVNATIERETIEETSTLQTENN